MANIKKAFTLGVIILAIAAACLIGYAIGTNATAGTGTILSHSFKASFTPTVMAMFLIYIFVSFIDVGTGCIKAAIQGNFTSSEMRKGIWKKAANSAIAVMTIIVNGVFHLLGVPIGTWLVMAVLVPMLAMEVGSNLENIGECGVPIPKVLRKALKALNSKGDEEPPVNLGE